VIVFHKDVAVCRVSIESGLLKAIDLDFLDFLLIAFHDCHFILIRLKHDFKMAMELDWLFLFACIYL
jgi:hypothetical protein